MPEAKPKIAIIGAGILGLAAAMRLAKSGCEVLVFEKDSHPGGLSAGFEIRGTALEKYHHFITQDDNHLFRMAKELDINHKIAWENTRLGYFVDGKTVPFTSPLDLMRFPSLKFSDKVRFALAMRRLTKHKNYLELEDIEARHWIIDECGENIYNVLWKHLMDLKFGSYVSEIPLSWFWARSTRRASSRKSLLASTERFGYMKGSFKTLVDALVNELEKIGVKIKLGEEVFGITSQNGEVCGVKTSSGEYDVSHVIATVPLPVFEKICELPDAYTASINRIKYAAIVNVIVELPERAGRFFWLNISDPAVPFPGIIEFTNLRPPEELGGFHYLYIPNYVEPGSELLVKSGDQIKELYMPSLERIYGPLKLEAFYVFKDTYADPYYSLNYSKIMPKFETPVKNLFLCNTSQIYPATRSVNNSIHWGERIASSLVK